MCVCIGGVAEVECLDNTTHRGDITDREGASVPLFKTEDNKKTNYKLNQLVERYTSV